MITPSGRRQTVLVWHCFSIMLVNEQDNVKHVLEQACTKLFKESFSADYRVVCVMSRKDVLPCSSFRQHIWGFGAQKAAVGCRGWYRCASKKVPSRSELTQFWLLWTCVYLINCYGCSLCWSSAVNWLVRSPAWLLSFADSVIKRQ